MTSNQSTEDLYLIPYVQYRRTRWIVDLIEHPRPETWLSLGKMYVDPSENANLACLYGLHFCH